MPPGGAPGGGMSAPPFTGRSKLLRSTQNSVPVPNTATIWPSQINRNNFQNSRPMLLADQLVTLPVDGLDAGAAVGQGAELAPDAGQMNVDAAIEADPRPPQRLLGQGRLADGPAGAAGQRFEQIEFGAGQVDRR